MTFTRSELLKCEKQKLTYREIGERHEPPVSKQYAEQIFKKLFNRPKASHRHKYLQSVCKTCGQKTLDIA